MWLLTKMVLSEDKIITLQADLVVCKRYKIKLAFNEFSCNKTKDTYKLGDRFLQKGNFQAHIHEMANKKSA